MRSTAGRVLLLAAFTLVALRLERRPVLNPGYALALCGLVLTCAVVLGRRLSRIELASWCVLALFLFGAEVHEAQAFRKAEQTFVVCLVRPDGRALLRRAGPDRLRDVTVRVIDHADLHALHARRSDDVEEFREVVQTVQLGNFMGGQTSKEITLKPLQAHAGRIQYQLFFVADTGRWWEALDLEQIGGHWQQAVRVWRLQNATPVLLYQSTDPAFDHAHQGANWEWAGDML